MTKSCCAGKSTAPKEKLYQKAALYRPLIVILLISAVAAATLSATGRVPLMDGLMGLFLCFLSALKLFNLTGFASGFAQYDLLAARSPSYGIVYPFVELALGILYLSGLWPMPTNIIMVIVMLIGTLGVIKTIRSGQSVRCACVGTGFNLPVGKVTLFENLVMGSMALLNLLAL